MIIVAVFKIRGQDRDGQRRHIQREVQPFAHGAKQLCKATLHQITKKIQRQHIEDQVHVVGMDKPASKEAVPLVLFCYGRRIKNKIVDDLAVAEAAERNQNGDDNDNRGDGQLHALRL